MLYDIAGIKIDFHFDFTNSNVFFDEYVMDNLINPDVDVYFNSSSEIGFPCGQVMKDDEFNWCIVDDRVRSIVVTNPLYPDSGEVICRFDIENDWRIVNILYSDSLPNIVEDVMLYLGNYIFRYIIVKHGGLLLHSSAIRWNGHGLAFTAPSGTGKSTHASLWKQHYGAVVLNDDSPVLRVGEKGVFVYGTPWSGSDRINTNGSAPLDMIVVLRQARENRLTRLDKHGILQKLLPGFLMPFYEDGMMKLAYDLIGRIIELTPVYLLECRPEKEAADLVLECLRGLG